MNIVTFLGNCGYPVVAMVAIGDYFSLGVGVS